MRFVPCRSGPPVDGPKDPWLHVLSLPERFVGDPASQALDNIIIAGITLSVATTQALSTMCSVNHEIKHPGVVTLSVGISGAQKCLSMCKQLYLL